MWENLLSALGGAIIGGGIAGFFSLKSTNKAHENAVALEEKKQLELMSGLLQGLHDELETLWDTYSDGVGVQLEALGEDKPLLMYYPVTQEYFPIYMGNSFLIGRIEDTDLRKKIVTTYTKARGLIDSYRLNNDMVKKFEHWQSMYRQTGQGVFNEHAEDYYGRLSKYAKKIKKSHDELKASKAEVLRALQKTGVLVGNNS
ncbi:hypothetical protein [Thiohalophilus thiocyanatoxydans]|uniref:Uncharacterized protein n=1 Tax=Thiohalophilus thiocyanatoxydans TaxID=381308 RepID=A0A4R8IUW9_9GAMM|nr:hypothetical protein [Thiohalophilus thiocyanatoxydans]TDY01113.1 hypothetical protein EDC23_1859 [Thiohalophilus thiocyanatoxydans]